MLGKSEASTHKIRGLLNVSSSRLPPPPPEGSLELHIQLVFSDIRIMEERAGNGDSILEITFVVYGEEIASLQATAASEVRLN